MTSRGAWFSELALDLNSLIQEFTVGYTKYNAIQLKLTLKDSRFVRCR